jgi:hypothetical protein
MKYALKKANCTKFASKCESSKTPFRKGVSTSFKLVMNPHIKKSEIMTARDDVNLEAEELFSINQI